jgi:SAM-dependent methyltransferase
MLNGTERDLKTYFATVAAEGIYPNEGNLRFYTRRLFEEVPLAGKTMLEIGGGSGYLSFYAASAGARRVVCLEPESAGSTSGVGSQFEALMRGLRRPEVELRKATFQSFDSQGERFDLLLLNSSINHLDENACIHLGDDPAARKRYHQIFEKMSRLTNQGGRLIATDCSRHNALGSLGLRHPLARSIDWEKHQSPRVWASLLRDHGFGRERIAWMSLNSLREPGRWLFGNGPAAFFLTSQFRLLMTRI